MNVRKWMTLAVAGATLGGGLAVAPAAEAVTATQSQRQGTSASQSCWYGGTHTIRGGRMQYYECRRTYRGKTQSSITIRVGDTRTDGYCVRGRGDIGNSKSTAGHRVYVQDCTTGGWTAWKRSGWWNGNQGYEYVYRVKG